MGFNAYNHANGESELFAAWDTNLSVIGWFNVFFNVDCASINATLKRSIYKDFVFTLCQIIAATIKLKLIFQDQTRKTN